MAKPNLEQISIDLRKRVIDAGVYLGFPRSYDEIRHLPPEVRQTMHHLQGLIDAAFYFSEYGLFGQQAHSYRVPLYIVKALDFLDIQDVEIRRSAFIAALDHDMGKFMMLDIVDKPGGFTPQDMERMREHPGTSAGMRCNLDSIEAGMIERHHAYQPNPYPSKFFTKTSPEIEYLTKILALIDFHDSAATRENDKFERDLIETVLSYATGNRLPSKKKVRQALLAVYGNLDVSYTGSSMPQSSRTGEQFIEEMYVNGIFGPENPLNPFTEADSFKFQRS